MIFLLITMLILLIISTAARVDLFQVIATSFSNLWWRILILMFVNYRLIASVLIISVRIICTMYDSDGLSEIFVLSYDNPDNPSGNSGGAQDSSTPNYIHTFEGRSPWTGTSGIRAVRITQEAIDSANQHVSPDYVRDFKIQLLTAAYQIYVPGKAVSLSDALIVTSSSNGDAAIARGHCGNFNAGDINVLSKYGKPGPYFRDLAG